ncbi:hypothetical protein ABZ547_42830 [Streptomyces sparsogenes]|uniref:hypothetical protein n=1 Tax=Streptomyces sparsogenes TaxID=67365 RepID=UPI0033C1AF86
MTTPWRTARRPLAPRVAAPREPVDPARIGRRVVQRRAKGMDADAVAAALEDARFDARQNSRHEDLADDVRGRAELAEWERLAQLLADAPSGTVYDPDVDEVVQAELAADAAAAAAREAELREAMRIVARADELQALRDLGTLDKAEPAEGDEAVRDELTRRAGGYVPADVDAWLAHALAAHRGHYRDPAAREEAAGLLTPRSSRTPRCSPNSPAWSQASTLTSWCSRPGSPPPNPKPLVRSPRFSPAPAPRATDVAAHTAR